MESTAKLYEEKKNIELLKEQLYSKLNAVKSQEEARNISEILTCIDSRLEEVNLLIQHSEKITNFEYGYRSYY